jgi:hypothetical protein
LARWFPRDLVHPEIPLPGLIPESFRAGLMRKPLIQFPALAAILVLLGFLMVMFRPAVFEGKLLAPADITRTLLAPWDESAAGAKPHNHYPSDAITQYLPYRIFAEESLRKDGYIGWNPYEMGGYNLAANTMALPGAWTMQLHRFLPFVQAWNWGIIAEFLIAGCGMLVFLRGRKLPWLASCLGALAFMANSQFIVWIYHRWALGSFCWMPWVLWAAGEGFETKGLTPRRMMLPVFLALALLGGSLQHMAFVVLACGCFVAGGLPTWKPTAATIRPVIVWGLAFGLALLASAFAWLPQLQGYLANSGMGYVRGQIGYAEGASQPAFNLVALFAQIWPWLVGDPQTVDGAGFRRSVRQSHASPGQVAGGRRLVDPSDPAGRSAVSSRPVVVPSGWSLDGGGNDRPFRHASAA